MLGWCGELKMVKFSSQDLDLPRLSENFVVNCELAKVIILRDLCLEINFVNKRFIIIRHIVYRSLLSCSKSVSNNILMLCVYLFYSWFLTKANVSKEMIFQGIDGL